ncbi:hypothetical protein DFH07DRAFT_765181 [Mycena maculata]|uniref:Uncharacterized protein n=1 Tax=Mycena maculata TaxID=230809 RepID=A0AAD7K8K2_9AGAR|nr:hypothetical protein DFH07DRAFT_765181 [Mycena maculata]
MPSPILHQPYQALSDPDEFLGVKLDSGGREVFRRPLRLPDASEQQHRRCQIILWLRQKSASSTELSAKVLAEAESEVSQLGSNSLCGYGFASTTTHKNLLFISGFAILNSLSNFWLQATMLFNSSIYLGSALAGSRFCYYLPSVWNAAEYCPTSFSTCVFDSSQGHGGYRVPGFEGDTADSESSREKACDLIT